MSQIDWAEYHEIDRGTISTKKRTARIALLESSGKPYVPYEQRVGAGLATAALELKRYIDRLVMPNLRKNISKITEDRFKKVYSDVRIYSALEKDEEYAPWETKKTKKPKKTDIYILINFVLAIPKNDSLDTMARATVNSLFNGSNWLGENKKISTLDKKTKLSEKMSIDAIMGKLNTYSLEGFPPQSDSKVELQIDCDGVIESNFEQLEQAALGPELLNSRITKLVILDGLKAITTKNVVMQVPILIAHLAKALGVANIDPKKLKAEDDLYALMGYEETLTISLQKSICLHFNTIASIGGNDIITVGNAIDFAREIIDISED